MAKRKILLTLLSIALLGIFYLGNWNLQCSYICGRSFEISHRLSNAFFFWHIPFTCNSHIVLATAIAILITSQATSLHNSALLTVFTLIASTILLGSDLVNLTSFLSYLLVFNIAKKYATNYKLLLTAMVIFILAGPSATLWALCAIHSSKRPRAQLQNLYSYLIFPLILLAAVYPPPQLPNYPTGATLVIDDGLPGLLRPYFGQLSPNLQIIDRLAEKSFLQYPALLVALTSGLLAYFNRLPLICVPAVLLILDLWLPETISQIMPVAVLRRTIPYAHLLPVASSLLALSIYSWSVFSSNAKTKVMSGIVCLVLIACFESYPPLPASTATLSASPSLATQRLNAGRLMPSDQIQSYNTVPAPLYSLESNLKGDVNAIKGRDKTTRIYSRGQSGGEYILIRLDQPRSIRGIKLGTGIFPNDFPQELTILDCDANLPLLEKYLWLGNLHTTDDGHMYFGPQTYEFQHIIFPRDIRTSCIKIIQSGDKAFFDWSVTSLRILESKV